MIKTRTFLLAAIILAGCLSLPAQTLSFGGHTYTALPALSLAEAQTTAATLGGHLVTVDSEAEYRFLDANYIKRGTGWWWTGSAGSFTVPGFPSGTWINTADGLWNHYISVDGRAHWNGANVYLPTEPGARILLAKMQMFNRSTTWVTKIGQWPATFAAYNSCRSIVELE